MIYAIVVVLVLIADQAVKFWVTKNIVLGATGDGCVSLIPGVVHLTNYHNTGAAFSMLANGRWLLIGITAVFIIVIIILISREIIRAPFGKWMAVLVLAGAIGNCIDRVLYGYVVDMFEVEFMNFAIFNVADIFITICGLLFCVHIIVHREPREIVEAEMPEPRRRARYDEPEEPVSEPVQQQDDAAARLARAMRAGAPAEQNTAPEYDFGYSVEMPQRRPGPVQSAPKQEPVTSEQEPAESKAPVDEFSLDAIMKEFGSF